MLNIDQIWATATLLGCSIASVEHQSAVWLVNQGHVWIGTEWQHYALGMEVVEMRIRDFPHHIVTALITWQRLGCPLPQTN